MLHLLFRILAITFAFTFLACKEAQPPTTEATNPVIVDTANVAIAPTDTNVVVEANIPTPTEKAETPSAVAVVPPKSATKVPDPKQANPIEAPKKQAEVSVDVVAPTPKPPIAATPKPQEKPAPKPVAQAPAPVAQEAKAALSHKIWDDLLRKYVSSTGIVDYTGIKAADKLDDYLEVLAANPPTSSWSKNKKIAYWINAYNAFTVKLIIKNHPVKSIRDLDNGDPWSKKWIKIGNDTYSLNQIEKEILIKQLGESRVHFAVNCAAVSCPPLLNRAYDEGSLEATLTQQTKAFLSNTAFNKVSPKALELSKIFDWYAADFGNDVVGFVRTKTGADIKDKPKVTFLEYNWKLNGK